MRRRQDLAVDLALFEGLVVAVRLHHVGDEMVHRLVRIEEVVSSLCSVLNSAAMVSSNVILRTRTMTVVRRWRG